MDYKSSGVDLEAGNEVVRRIKGLAQTTFTPAVLSQIGSFGGLYRLGTANLSDPVLVSSVDGVGTKLKVAFLARRHQTIGEDLVNHCVNDILVQGAQPLFFLDYLATGKLNSNVAIEVVEGLVRACTENDCSLLGGETAEMPGFYVDGEYDLAGFIVGVVERNRIVDGANIVPGDRLIGLPSNGLHTNGYSLARRVVFDQIGLSIDETVPELGETIGEALLRPHRSYLTALRPLLREGLVKGMAHVTGGGITENLPRVLPSGCAADVNLDAWSPPRLFNFLQKRGQIPTEEMYRTFNMGIGLIVICASKDVERTSALLCEHGVEDVRLIGRVIDGARVVHYGQF